VSGLYEAGVLSQAPTNADGAFIALWNTSGSARIFLREFGIVAAASSNTAQYICKRLTARGTQTSTLAGTPVDNADAAAKGTLDFAWSVQPTVGTVLLHPSMALANAGMGQFFQWWSGSGLVIPAGAGVAVVAVLTASNGVQECHATWEESGG
jgi:hypothetical protein